MKVSILRLAKSDLREMHEYLSEHGDDPPIKFRASFEKFIEQVSAMPNMYSKYEYAPAYRVAVIAFDYLVFYQADESAGEVKIYRVLHGRRNIAPLLAQP